MASETLDELLRPRMFVLKLLWLCLTATILFFVLLAYLLVSQNLTNSEGVNPELKIAMYAIAVAIAVISFLLRRAWLSKIRAYSTKVGKMDMTGLAVNAETGQVDEARLAKLKSLRPDEAKVLAMTGRYFTAMLLCLSMHEMIVICGLMLVLWDHKFESILPFAALALLMNLTMYPRLDKFIDRTAPMKAQF